MIGVFPDPHPDEIFYSICARLCERAGYSKHRIAMRDLFGCEAVVASVTLPSHLDDLVARLPPESVYTSDYLLVEHTLLPFYSPFLPPERVSRLRQDMCGRKGPAIHMRSGVMASRVPLPGWLRFCPQCVAEDRNRFGECYWHRVHQISGVELCPFHEVYLQDSDVQASNKRTRHEYVAAERSIRGTIQHQPDTQSPYHQVFLEIARDVYWLLCQHRLLQDLNLLHQRYRQLLAEINLATYRGRVDVHMFMQMFRKYYPARLLRLLHCELEEGVQETWLLRLVRTPHGTQHPLHHLLLLHFLGYTAEGFFSIPTENKPFGDGPWPCLNPTCDRYRQPQIEECHVIHSQNVGGRPIGMFACKCGFTYARTGPDASANDRFTLNRVKSFGHVWEARLQLLWNDKTVSLRRMAQQLGVDPLTVKRHATRTGLPFPRPAGNCQPLKEAQRLHPHKFQTPGIDIVERHRAMWLATVQENPGGGISAVREKIPGVYVWLYRNDRIWLKTHMPLCKKEKSRRTRVDWESRDIELAEKVKLAASEIKSEPGRPIQLTITAIGREIGQLALIQQHLNKLPLTSHALTSIVETREDFAIRKIWWAVEQYRLKSRIPIRWELVKIAGVERIALQTTIQAAIQEALLFLQKQL